MNKINNEEFSNLVLPLFGLTVSCPWLGYGSALFLELGKLQQPRDSHLKHPSGEACIMIEWDWRVENDKEILFGSSNSRPKMDKGISQLSNLKINSISLIGKPSEILVNLSNGIRLQTMAMISGGPQWSIKLIDGTWLCYEGAFLVQKGKNEGSGGLTEEENEVMNLADETVARWKQPFIEPKLGNCNRCKYFVQLDGEFALLDYGVCIASGSQFDGHAVSTSSGCPKYISIEP